MKYGITNPWEKETVFCIVWIIGSLLVEKQPFTFSLHIPLNKELLPQNKKKNK